MCGVRQGMHAAQSARRHDGLVRGGLRRLLRLSAGPVVIDIEGWSCPVPLRDTPQIVMGHRGGGAMSGELVAHLFRPAFGAAAGGTLGHSAVVTVGASRIAFSTD